ncbi:MAG TPA: bifunctional DNA primase/polymerase [Pseudonocardiaceae bacterium]|nr:bifunctional DNA primase/polymerase [Pseudonocardiaceae bacterium]
MIRALATLGMHLFPVDHPDLFECIGRHAPDRPCNGERGKHPEPWSWSRESTNDPTMLDRMFSRRPRNVGIDCGRSRLIVLDEDAPGELDRLCINQGQLLPVTLTVSTGKGRHVYLRQPVELPYTNAAGALRNYKIDVRGRGGYVVGPGSQHATGRTYSLLIAAPIAPVPPWVAALLRPPAPPPRPPADMAFAGSKQALTGVLRVVLNAPEGKRNTMLNWASYRMFEKVRAGLLSDTAATGMLLDAAAVIGLPEGEARATVRSARRAVLGG